MKFWSDWEKVRGAPFISSSTLSRASNNALKHVVRAEKKDLRFIEQMETEFAISSQFNHPNLRKSIDLKITRTLLRQITEAYMLMDTSKARPSTSAPPSDLMDVLDTFILTAQGLKAMHQMVLCIATSSPTTSCATTRAR